MTHPSKPIGGYLELESLTKTGTFQFNTNAIFLNSGRNCFEYILKAQGVRHVYMPKLTCDVMFESLGKLGIGHSFYSLNTKLEIVDSPYLEKGEMIVYTNYFGVKDSYCNKLVGQYKDQLILDCAQAFYFTAANANHVFYSPRKFFGLPDGGILYTDKILGDTFERDISYTRMSHLLKRIDLGAEAGYEDFKTNDKTLDDEPIKLMSRLTKALLETIDLDESRERRINNYQHLSKGLDSFNSAEFIREEHSCPLVYPLIVNQDKNEGLRKYLIERKIYVATYWPNVLRWFSENEGEHQLAKNILPLPIDQRYNEQDMQRIIDVIKEY